MELSTQIFNELVTIKWLLLIMVFLSLLILIIFYKVATSIIKNQNITVKSALNQKNIREFDKLLADGNAKEVKYSSMSWITRDKDEPYAYWYLAKAYYDLGEKINAKQNFVKVIEVAPDWSDVANEWIERIDAELSCTTPTVIK